MRARKPGCAVADAFHACAATAGLLHLFGESIRLRFLATATLGHDDCSRWRSNYAAPCKALKCNVLTRSPLRACLLQSMPMKFAIIATMRRLRIPQEFGEYQRAWQILTRTPPPPWIVDPAISFVTDYWHLSLHVVVEVKNLCQPTAGSRGQKST